MLMMLPPENSGTLSAGNPDSFQMATLAYEKIIVGYLDLFNRFFVKKTQSGQQFYTSGLLFTWNTYRRLILINILPSIVLNDHRCDWKHSLKPLPGTRYIVLLRDKLKPFTELTVESLVRN